MNDRIISAYKNLRMLAGNERLPELRPGKLRFNCFDTDGVSLSRTLASETFCEGWVCYQSGIKVILNTQSGLDIDDEALGRLLSAELSVNERASYHIRPSLSHEFQVTKMEEVEDETEDRTEGGDEIINVLIKRVSFLAMLPHPITMTASSEPKGKINKLDYDVYHTMEDGQDVEESASRFVGFQFQSGVRK
ncbi:MAG: hypothetical protein GKR95_22755 [Gammaproteobacteria bacterium]|nr:hypothetical protein [Gammaproteobacteria bacterium]